MELLKLEDEIFLIKPFLPVEECKKLIELSESIGFSEADVQMLHNKRQLFTNIRNNERVNYESGKMAQHWWNKLVALPLPEFEGKKAVGLSPFFRFYKYAPGQKFNMHKDGRQKVGDNTTFFTLLVYLNDECEGGSTKFRQGNIEVVPQIGCGVLFQHHLWHQGVKVVSGVKYVLRTDVLYTS